jgi:hypothetical protein
VILPRHVEGFAKSGAALLHAIKLICRRRPENLIVQKTQLVVEDDEIAGKISVPSQYLRINCPLRFTIVYHFNVKNDSINSLYSLVMLVKCMDLMVSSAVIFYLSMN